VIQPKPQKVEDITCRFLTDGKVVTQQLEKKILADNRGYALIAYLMKENKSSKGGWQRPFITIRRYRRLDGWWKQVAKLNLSFDLAPVVAKLLTEWKEENYK